MFKEDSRTVDYLRHMGAPNGYTNSVLVTQLRNGWWVTNLGRPVAKVDEAILDYGIRMEAGSAAPAPILRLLDDGYEVLDGVQRLLAAIEIGRTEISAYVVTIDSDRLAQRIRVYANLHLQGHQPPADWSRKQIVQIEIIEAEQPASVKEVAAMTGWGVKEVQEEVTYQTGRLQIISVGGSDVKKKKTCLIMEAVKPHSIVNLAEPIAMLTNTIVAAKYVNGEVESLISDVFEGVSKKNAYPKIHKRIVEWCESEEVQTRLSGRKGRSNPLPMELRRHLKAARTVATKLAASSKPVPYVDEYFRLLNDIRDRVSGLTRRTEKSATAGRR